MAKPKLLIQRGTELYPAELVGQAEVSELTGLQRQAVHKFMRRKRNPFPQPVIRRDRLLLWDRRDVLAWAQAHFRRRGERKRAKELREVQPLEAASILEAAAEEQTDWLGVIQRIGQGSNGSLNL
jgi:predicted DNA-binding transcriptional regulator AlpA